MDAVKQAHELSVKMIQILNNEQEQSRTELIEQITKLIAEREEVIKRIKPPYTGDEKSLGKEIVQMNKEIEEKMNALYEDLKEEIVQFKKQKSQNRSYINPYGKMKTTDGMYMDRKQ